MPIRGSTDSGVRDAATTDAGDAGTTDAGTTDAGTTDAGDAATLDGAASDAALDAGVDAGPPIPSALCEGCSLAQPCAEGLACVVDPDDGTDRCLPVRPDTGGCLEVAPFAERLASRTIDGTDVVVCRLERSSCAAFNDYHATACSGDEDCGLVDLADGLCRDADPTSATVLRCTLPCVSSDDCPSGVSCVPGTGACAL